MLENWRKWWKRRMSSRGLDARDPAGSPLPVESAVRRAPGKRLVLVLNKVDLVPREIATRVVGRFAQYWSRRRRLRRRRRAASRNQLLDSAKDAAVVDEGAMGRSTALGVDGLLHLESTRGTVVGRRDPVR